MRPSCWADGLVWFVNAESDNQGLFSLSLKKNVFKKYLHNGSPPYSLRAMTNINDTLLKVNGYRGGLVLNIKNGKHEK